MARLPQCSGQECRQALERAGFYFVRWARDTHFYMHRDDPPAHVSIPNRRKLGPGILRSIIRDAGLTVDEFVKYLNS
jgi:predicted RNA binding protein YcfA (HicA-like mRNA interferase family)